jgi:predicted O-linked N-acetylglucosamine transferase (SPINDLY family)
MLSALDLPELITTSVAEYESLAYELANSPEKLQQIKTKLAKNRFNSPLFNSDLMARELESAYSEMYKRFQEALPPVHINLN